MKYLFMLLLLVGCVRTIEKPVYIPKEVKVVVSVPCLSEESIPAICPVPPVSSSSNTAEAVQSILLENQCLIENDLRFRALLSNCTERP